MGDAPRCMGPHPQLALLQVEQQTPSNETKRQKGVLLELNEENSRDLSRALETDAGRAGVPLVLRFSGACQANAGRAGLPVSASDRMWSWTSNARAMH